MSGNILVYTLISVCAAPVPPIPANQAPPPRLVKPDASLLVVDIVQDTNGSYRGRVRGIGFRNGKSLAAEKVWEGDTKFLDRDTLLPGELTDGWQYLVADRYLVTGCGGVIDVREKKVLNTEQRGLWVWCDEKKVTYSLEDPNREQGRFTFEYANGILTRTGEARKAEWIWKLRVQVELSPDKQKGIEWRGDDELILHRKGQEPKSLGKGFTLDVPDELAKGQIELSRRAFPRLWLDDTQFLTQRGNGKLVVVDLAGNVSDVASIKGVPKVAAARLFRDGSGAIIYEAASHYAIDIAKKTAKKSEWEGLGNGFEVSWTCDKKLGHKLRHNGQSIGWFRCDPATARTAPGYLAICKDGEPDDELPHPRGTVVVWSATTERWTTLQTGQLARTPTPGWIK